MNRKKFYLIIGAIIILFLAFLYFFTTGRLGFNEKQTVLDTTKAEYSNEVLGCVTLSSNATGASVSISSVENSYQKISQLPIRECVPVGKYLFSVYANSYKTHQSDVTITQGQDIDLKTDLEYIGQSEDEESNI